MMISVVDGSNYFKGLLLLIRKDRRVTDSERQLMEHIGKSLGFERGFYVKAIQEILVNHYIVDEPPVFSKKELATLFIKDGFAIANSDNEIHSFEKEWLKVTAKKNFLDLNWFQQEFEISKIKIYPTAHMEVDALTIQY